MNWGMNWVLIHHIVKAKRRKNRRKTKSCPKNEPAARTRARTTVRPGRSRCFSNSAFWPLLDLDLGRGIFMYWAYFAALLDLLASTSFSLDSTLTFLLKTWLESYKSTINTQQAKTEHNWRNRGVNNKIKPIYPQEWILNIYLILCKYGTDQTPPCLNCCLSSSKTLDMSNQGYASRINKNDNLLKGRQHDHT